MQETSKIWMNGELVDWADATVHVGSPRVVTGPSVLRSHPGGGQRAARRAGALRTDRSHPNQVRRHRDTQ